MTDAPPSSPFVRYRTLILVGLGLRDLWYPDEPDIAEVCKAMFESGDWIAPRRMGLIWVDYRPGVLFKGPLGLLLPGLVLVLWHGARREWRRIFELAPLSPVALAVYLPWFVACARAMGADDILYELHPQNFERFVSGSRGHERPFHYYFVNIWWDLHPGHSCCPLPLYTSTGLVSGGIATSSCCSGGSSRSCSSFPLRRPSVSSTCCPPTRRSPC